MTVREPVEPSPAHDREAWREGVVMVLYVSIVLLAALSTLPTGTDGDGHADGVHGWGLLGLVWGTTVGLALAHWFAFRVAARGFGGGTLDAADVRAGAAQLAGALVVAVLCSIPVLLFDEDVDVQATGFVPAWLIGLAGYLGSRAAGRRLVPSLVTGGIVLAVGLAVAAVKATIGGH